MTRVRRPLLTTGAFASLGLFAVGFTGCSGTPEPSPHPDAVAKAETKADAPPADDGDAAGPDPGKAADDDGTEPEPEPPKNAARGLEPLPADVAETFRAGETEQLGQAEITYLKTNEIRHDVWFPYVTDLGGGYVGVGSDQNYTLIAVARSELVFLTDIDPRVPKLHALYEVLIEKAETPEEHMMMWAPKNEESTLAVLEEAFADRDEDERKRLLREYRADRETVWRHLERVRARHRDDEMTTWLSNPEYYAHVRKLFLNDRIRYEAGDLTGPKTMKLAGEIFTKLDVPVGLLYLSNAEEYFTYTQQYRDNISGLPANENSIVVRTIYNKEKNKDYEMADSLWNYQVQYLRDFQTRLEDKQNSTRNRMIRFAEKDGEFERHPEVSGLSRLNIEKAP